MRTHLEQIENFQGTILGEHENVPLERWEHVIGNTQMGTQEQLSVCWKLWEYSIGNMLT